MRDQAEAITLAGNIAPIRDRVENTPPVGDIAGLNGGSIHLMLEGGKTQVVRSAIRFQGS